MDSETYPVDQSIADRWYVGNASAASGRWGFAFSIKEDWASKVRSDVASALSTGRGYAMIFFVTSRYAPDRRRSLLEDELSRTAGAPVTILDRTWILEKIYGNDRLDLAIEALGLTPDRTAEQIRIGPRDAERLRRLEELDRQIGDPLRYVSARYSLAEDCLNSALLARGLERPRAEVEARFRQTRRIADEVGVANQRLRVLYHEAWTAHWWHQDLATLLENHLAIEALATGTDDADDVEKLGTLAKLLTAATRSGLLDASRIGLAERLAAVEREYRRLAADRTRPNTALQARFGLELIEIENAAVAADAGRLEAAWRRIAAFAPESEPLLSFPLERTVRLCEHRGTLLPGRDAHDVALDAFLPVLERRRSQAAAGTALLRRGLQRLEKGNAYDAIRLLGRAELKLAKEEYRGDLVTCLHGLAVAYDRAGLPWAARTKTLLAADQGFAILRDEGDVPSSLVTSLYKLTVAELKLGRVQQAIAAWRHLATISSQLKLGEAEVSALREDLSLLDFMLGYLLLRAPEADLRAMERLPDALARVGLPRSRMLLLWALGHEDAVREDYVDDEDRGTDVDALFRSGLRQPAMRELPAVPVSPIGGTIRMSCSALGCEFQTEAADDLASIRVAEAIMSAIQAFLATSLAQPVVPWREGLRFAVHPGSPDETFATRWHDDVAEPWAEVLHPARPQALGEGLSTAFNDWLHELIAQTLARSLVPTTDAHAWLETVAGEEEGLGRAIALGNIPVLHSSVFGDQPTHSVAHWLRADDRHFPYMRREPWTADEPRAELKGTRAKTGQGSEGGFDHEAAPHSRRRVISIINLPLWDAARWSGVGQLVYPAGGPPILALAFADIGAAARIFEEWRARFGERDEEDAIRACLIQGLKSARPAEYGVTIGRDLESLGGTHEGDTFVVATRCQRMHPVSSENLNRFLAAYAKEGCFQLAPSLMTSEPTLDDFRLDLAITKRRLTLRRAWEIGPNDLDLTALQDDDDPVVPDHVTDPPSAAGLAAMREMRASRITAQKGPTSRW